MVLCGVQELLTKEVLNLDDLDRIMGKRPFVTLELRNVDKFRGLSEWLPTGGGIWSWIESFRSPGLPLSFPAPAVDGLGGAPMHGFEASDSEGSRTRRHDDDDDSSGGGGGGGGGKEGMSGWWADEVERSATKVQDIKRKYPTAT